MFACRGSGSCRCPRRSTAMLFKHLESPPRTNPSIGSQWRSVFKEGSLRGEIARTFCGGAGAKLSQPRAALLSFDSGCRRGAPMQSCLR